MRYYFSSNIVLGPTALKISVWSRVGTQTEVAAIGIFMTEDIEPRVKIELATVVNVYIIALVTMPYATNAVDLVGIKSTTILVTCSILLPRTRYGTRSIFNGVLLLWIQGNFTQLNILIILYFFFWKFTLFLDQGSKYYLPCPLAYRGIKPKIAPSASTF